MELLGGFEPPTSSLPTRPGIFYGVPIHPLISLVVLAPQGFPGIQFPGSSRFVPCDFTPFRRFVGKNVGKFRGKFPHIGTAKGTPICVKYRYKAGFSQQFSLRSTLY